MREAAFPSRAKPSRLVDRESPVVAHGHLAWCVITQPVYFRVTHITATMWTAHAGPGSRGQMRTAQGSGENTTSSAPSGSGSSSRARPSISQHQYTVSALEAENYADFFEPAIEGPPSPGRIRAFSNKVKQASVSERHVSQQTASSGASSSHSYAPPERPPSWEQALDSFSLSRKSSIKSTTSSMPSRERPESVQAIGKAIFNRKTKLRRESLVTSGSSTYSAEVAPDVTSDRSRAASVSKENIMSLFNRRKTVQAGDSADAASAQKRPLISSPFNFQHVTQIQRDQLPNLDRADKRTLQNELLAVRTPPAAEDLRVPNFSSRATRPRDDDESIPPHVVPHSRESSTSRPPSFQKSPPRQWLKQTKSQDRMQGPPPPRPPRSPTELDMDYFNFAPPLPSSRNLGRTSVPRRDSEALGNTMTDRHHGMGNFRFPAPLNLQADASSPPSTSSGAASPSFHDDRRYSRVFVAADNPNWPLTCPLNNASVSTFEAALPDVPEEEEQHGIPRKSRASDRSANSSLKGSVSVPALRKLSLSNASHASHDRSYSRESVVFGQFDLSANQAAGHSPANTTQYAEPLHRDSWEDVIDYCYEHEAEADCDFDWHRPSIDMDQEPTVLVTESEDNDCESSRPTSDCIEMPALSPSNHLSPASTQEVLTPMLTASATRSPTSANFSLPRRERPQRPLHVRTGSQASFKESQGFTLSPSFLIPTDYHQELLAARSEQYDDPESIAQAVTFEDATLTMENTNLFVPARASNSTTASASNLSSRSVFERHISSTSTNTDYTRLTMSTNSVDMEGFIFKDSPVAAPEEQAADCHLYVASAEPHAASPHGRSQSAAGLLGPKSPALTRDTHGSESNLTGLQSPKGQAGRARSRTMSSTPGQFSLFPKAPRAA